MAGKDMRKLVMAIAIILLNAFRRVLEQFAVCPKKDAVPQR